MSWWGHSNCLAKRLAANACAQMEVLMPLDLLALKTPGGTFNYFFILWGLYGAPFMISISYMVLTFLD